MADQTGALMANTALSEAGIKFLSEFDAFLQQLEGVLPPGQRAAFYHSKLRYRLPPGKWDTRWNALPLDARRHWIEIAEVDVSEKELSDIIHYHFTDIPEFVQRGLVATVDQFDRYLLSRYASDPKFNLVPPVAAEPVAKSVPKDLPFRRPAVPTNVPTKVVSLWKRTVVSGRKEWLDMAGLSAEEQDKYSKLPIDVLPLSVQDALASVIGQFVATSVAVESANFVWRDGRLVENSRFLRQVNVG